MYNLKGKTAVITGGNSGVGAATAMLFAKSGANVVISARRQAALDEVASKIKAEGGNVLTVLTDISKDEDCKNLMKATVDKFGGIDILVNNAGVLDTGLAPIDKFDDVEIQKLSYWYVNQTWATEYSKGRVFCGGDAVHRHPPSSGLGSNTCMQDAFNLGWKLAFAVKGWAQPSLLNSYTTERAPVGKQIVARANQSRFDYNTLKRSVWI